MYTPQNLHMIWLPKRTLPTSQKIQNNSGHNLMNTKQDKNHIPSLPRKRAMKQQVIIHFPICLTQATPTIKNYVLIPQVVSSEYPPQGSYPHEKRNPWRNFRLPNALPRKRIISPSRKNLIIGTHFETLLWRRLLANSVINITVHLSRIEKILEWRDGFQLPLLDGSNKIQPLISRVITYLHIMRN